MDKFSRRNFVLKSVADWPRNINSLSSILNAFNADGDDRGQLIRSRLRVRSASDDASPRLRARSRDHSEASRSHIIVACTVRRVRSDTQCEDRFVLYGVSYYYLNKKNIKKSKRGKKEVRETKPGDARGPTCTYIQLRIDDIADVQASPPVLVPRAGTLKVNILTREEEERLCSTCVSECPYLRARAHTCIYTRER